MSSPLDEIEALKSQVAALTARVYQLEQERGVSRRQAFPAEQTQPTTPFPGGSILEAGSSQSVSVPIPASPPPLPNTSMTPSASSRARAPREDTDLEKKIGQYWLNRIGIVAMLIGVSYFLKYAFDNDWVGPSGRITIGLLLWIGLFLWSERFRSRGYDAFSYSLKAVGIGTLYLSLWGAFQIYPLIPATAAFLAMILVTASTIALALSQDAELLATFAMIGGFATPALLSTGQNHEAVLFCYVALLDVAILLMAVVKPWRRLLWGSFAGTIVLYVGWYSSYYTREQRPLTVFFAALFTAIFAAIPLATRYERSTRFSGPSITLTLLPLLNALIFFLQLYILYERE